METSRDKRLLFVEDEFRVADFLVRRLAPLGIEVTVVEDGDVARFLAATEQFDAVLLDLGPSVVAAHDVLRFLRLERPATPVIVLTATDGSESRTALAHDASACVTKPIVFEDLRERILACLGARQLEMRLSAARRGLPPPRMTP